MLISVNKIEKVDIKGKGEKIVAFGRDKNHKKVITESYGHEPYFYVLSKEVIPNHHYIQRTESGYESVFHEDVTKIITVNSNNVPYVRKIFNSKSCYEDDVLYIDRWAIDLGIKNGMKIPNTQEMIHCSDIKPASFFVQPRRLHIDIEVISGVGNKLPDYENPIRRITSISCIDNYTRLITTFTNRPEYGNKLLKKLKIAKTKILYTEENKYEKSEMIELTTEIGTKYKWRRIYYKTEIIVHFKDSSFKAIKKKEDVELYMLNRFIAYFRKINPDFFCGWNIDGFDLPYIVFRMKYLGINYKRLSPINSVSFDYYEDRFMGVSIKGVVVFDTMVFYKKMHTHKISGKLNDAANLKLGYGKVKYSGSLDNLYETNEETFLEYNAIDVVMEYEIFEKMGMMDFYSGLRRYIGCQYESMKDNSKIIDFYLLSKAKEFGLVLPSARFNKELAKKLKIKKSDKKRFGGGHVPIPKRVGRSQYILTVDLKSLYPMIMITFNLGADTLIIDESQYSEDNVITTPEIEINDFMKRYLSYNPIIEVSGKSLSLKFVRNTQSFVAVCLKELIDYRDNLKQKLFRMKNDKSGKYDKSDIENLDNIQTVVKFITNTIYGILGYPNFRLFNLLIAACVTRIGRMITIDTIDFSDEYELICFILMVLYGDTDSAMVQLIKHIDDIKNAPKDAIDYFLEIFDSKCPIENKKDFDFGEKVLIGMSYELSDKLNEYYQRYIDMFNLKENYLQIKPEDVAKTFFNVKTKKGDRAAKKKYAKKLIIEFGQDEFGNDKPFKVDKINIKGLIKSNISVIGNKNIKDVMDLVCSDDDNETARVKVAEHLRILIKDILEGKYPLTDICKRIGMNKSIKDYANDEHARAGRWCNEHAHIWGGTSNYGKGSTVKLLYVKVERMFGEYSRTDVIALDDNNYIPKKFEEIIDYNKIINKTIIEPISQVLDALSISYNYITTGKEEKKIF